MPGARQAHLKRFFEAYERRMNDALASPPIEDVEASADAFADCFIEASPTGFICGKNNDAFRDMIPRGYAFYRSIGTQRMDIAGLAFTHLDELHDVVTVHWQAHYKKPDASELRIDFDVFYFVQTLAGQSRIFGYVTGNEQQVLRDHGLLPSTSES